MANSIFNDRSGINSYMKLWLRYFLLFIRNIIINNNYKMTKEFSYFKKYLPELEKQYRGEVIAISDKKIIAHGKNMDKVYKDARRVVGDEHFFVTKIPKEKEVLIL